MWGLVDYFFLFMLFLEWHVLNPSDFIGIYNIPKFYMPFASYSSFNLSNKAFLYIVSSFAMVLMSFMGFLPFESLGTVAIFVSLLIISKDGMASEQLITGFLKYHLNSSKNKKEVKKEKVKEVGDNMSPSGVSVILNENGIQGTRNLTVKNNTETETIPLKNDTDIMNLTLNVGTAYSETYVTVHVDGRKILHDVVDESGKIIVSSQPFAGEKIFEISPDDELLPSIRRKVMFV